MASSCAQCSPSLIIGQSIGTRYVMRVRCSWIPRVNDHGVSAFFERRIMFGSPRHAILIYRPILARSLFPTLPGLAPVILKEVKSIVILLRSPSLSAGSTEVFLGPINTDTTDIRSTGIHRVKVLDAQRIDGSVRQDTVSGRSAELDCRIHAAIASRNRSRSRFFHCSG